MQRSKLGSNKPKLLAGVVQKLPVRAASTFADLVGEKLQDEILALDAAGAVRQSRAGHVMIFARYAGGHDSIRQEECSNLRDVRGCTSDRRGAGGGLRLMSAFVSIRQLYRLNFE